MVKVTEERRLSSEFGKEKAIVHDNVRYGTSILPFSSHHLDRVVELGDRSLVEGDVYGRKVEMGVEAVVTGKVFAQDWATIGLGSKVLGDVISRGSVVLEDGTHVGETAPANIIAMDIKLGRKCVVTGNIIGRRSVEIAEDCIIKGVVICLAGPLTIGARSAARDAMSHSVLTIGAGVKIQDPVLWSHMKIEGAQVDLDGGKPQTQHNRSWEGAEVNLNTDRMTPPKEVEQKADDRWYKAMREILDPPAVDLRPRKMIQE